MLQEDGQFARLQCIVDKLDFALAQLTSAAAASAAKQVGGQDQGPASSQGRGQRGEEEAAEEKP